MGDLTRLQFGVLGILARNPKRNRLAWSGCGAASFGLRGKTVIDRPNQLIVATPQEFRWPGTVTIKSLERKAFIKEARSENYFFYRIYRITKRGLRAYATADTAERKGDRNG